MESAMNALEDRLQRRCDRCGAVAKFEVQVTQTSELLFCTHHATEHAHEIDARYPVTRLVVA